MYRRFFKRLLDLFFASAGIIVSWPLMSLIAIALRAEGKTGKIFFIQPRPGRDGIIFNIIKFRTMNDCVDGNGALLPDPERLTPVGKLLRSLCLDELPQLFNILKGEMSFVGPRPLLIKYLSLYDDTQRRRHEVRPGIMGWAQTHGRNLALSKKFSYDVWYVDNISFATDMYIIFMTFRNLLANRNGGGWIGMEEVDDLNFRGRYIQS